jgi:hypothetical protein
MKRVITVSDVQDYLNQFDGNAEITLMEEDKPIRTTSDEAAADGEGNYIGFVCLETMMDQFHDMGGN